MLLAARGGEASLFPVSTGGRGTLCVTNDDRPGRMNAATFVSWAHFSSISTKYFDINSLRVRASGGCIACQGSVLGVSSNLLLDKGVRSCVQE